MNGVALLLAAATFGVAYSWQKTDDGQVEYLIQAEAEVLPALVRGEQIHSPVPAEAGIVNRFRFRISAQGDPAAEQAKPASRFGGAAAANSIVVIKPGSEPVETADVSTGWETDKAGVRQFYVQIDPFLMRQLGAGDEILVPVPPIAGPIGNFVVSSGATQLPRSPAPADTAGSPSTQPSTNAAASPSSRFTDPGTADPADASQTSRFGGTDAPAGNNASSPTAGGGQPGPSGASPPPAGESPSRFTGGDLAGGNPSRFNPMPEASSTPATKSPASQYGQDNRSTGSSRPSSNSGLWPSNPPTTGNSAAASPPPLADSRPSGFGGGLDRGTGNFESPRPLPTNPPQGQRTGYETPADSQVAMNTPPASPRTTTRKTSKSPNNDEAEDAAPAEKPWGWFVFVFCVMCLSLGANLYLGWTAAEFYSRYRTAVERLRTSGARP